MTALFVCTPVHTSFLLHICQTIPITSLFSCLRNVHIVFLFTCTSSCSTQCQTDEHVCFANVLSICMCAIDITSDQGNMIPNALSSSTLENLQVFSAFLSVFSVCASFDDLAFWPLVISALRVIQCILLYLAMRWRLFLGVVNHCCNSQCALIKSGRKSTPFLSVFIGEKSTLSANSPHYAPSTPKCIPSSLSCHMIPLF